MLKVGLLLPQEVPYNGAVSYGTTPQLGTPMVRLSDGKGWSLELTPVHASFLAQQLTAASEQAVEMLGTKKHEPRHLQQS